MGLVMQGREGKPSKEPIKIDIGEAAVDIASGGDHLVILSVSIWLHRIGFGPEKVGPENIFCILEHPVDKCRLPIEHLYSKCPL